MTSNVLYGQKKKLKSEQFLVGFFLLVPVFLKKHKYSLCDYKTVRL